VRAQVGPDVVEGAGDPVLDAVRVQAVHEQQPGHQLVCGEALHHLVAERASPMGDVEHPFQACAVQIDDQPDQLLGPLPRHRAGRVGGAQQVLDAVSGGLQIDD
jgi:hypothetical protein